MADSDTWDVFLSHSHKNKDLADGIHAALVKADLRVWYDTTEIATYEDIKRRVQEGLIRSKTLLALYSHAYPQSQACQYEWTAALLATLAEPGEGGRPNLAKRILVVNPEQGPRHIEPLEMQNALYHSAVDDLAALAAGIRERVARLETTLGAAVPLYPRWYGRQPLRASTFVGRLPELWCIHSALGPELGFDIRAAQNLAVVSGFGGMGKSLLVEEYAQRFALAWPGGVFWLSAALPEERQQDKQDVVAMSRLRRAEALQKLARELGPGELGIQADLSTLQPKDLEDLLRRALERREPYLWIVDDLPRNLPINDEFRAWLSPTNTKGHTLITTRSGEYDRLEGALPLDVLAPEAALALLTSHRRPHGSEEEQAAEAICKELGYHALVVDVAASLIKGVGFVDFLELLRGPEVGVGKLFSTFCDQLPNGHEASIVRTFATSLDALSEDARDLLRMAAQLAPGPIPVALLIDAVRRVDDLKPVVAKLRITGALQRARVLSLVKDVDGVAGKEAIDIHPLLRRVMAEREGYQRPADAPIVDSSAASPPSSPPSAPLLERWQALRQALVEALIDFLKESDDIRAYAKLLPLIEHARELARGAGERELELLARLSRFDCVAGRYKQASVGWERVWHGREALLGAEHSETLGAKGSFAEILYRLGKYPDARRLREEVLAVWERTSESGSLDILSAKVSLAFILWAQGEYKGARALEEEVVAARERILGPEHLDTLLAKGNLAATLYFQGENAGARGLLEEVVAARKRALDSDPLDIANSKNNLGEALRGLNRCADARKLILIRALIAGHVVHCLNGQTRWTQVEP
ncbi:MAG: toll/interleukin-1 receptor domain-containing protein [Magnetococcales bacterium]|nr:toll/interleukin-1 receptor domain-containing protein [Magnetococcales bacterium]